MPNLGTAAAALSYGAAPVLIAYRGATPVYHANATPGATHVFAMIGQSNMIGRPTHDGGTFHPAGVQQWGRSGGNNGTLIAATSPLDHVNPTTGDMGLDISFAEDWLAAVGGSLVFVPSAQGGTSLSSGTWQKGGARYEDAVARINAVMAANPSFVFGGFLWHQGESDEGNASYQTQLDQMIADIRTDVTVADATTPFVVGGLVPTWAAGNANRTAIQNTIADTPNRVASTAFASSDGLTAFDGLHFDAASLRTFGRRYMTAHALAAANATALAPPTAVGTIPNQTSQI